MSQDWLVFAQSFPVYQKYQYVCVVFMETDVDVLYVLYLNT